MSPEQQIPSSEKPKKEYDLIVDKLISDIKNIPDDEAQRRKVTIDDFLLDVIDRADAGEIIGSRGNVYDRQAMMAQLALYDKDLNANEPDPEVRIPGFNGLRDAFRTLASNDATGRYLADSLDEIVHGDWRERQLKQRSIETGEREPISKVEEKVGGATLDAVGVQEPQPETDLEMYERFLRETQEELHELYAQHRQLDPKSYGAQSVANQIKQAKEAAGSYAKKAAQLKGNSNWT